MPYTRSHRSVAISSGVFNVATFSPVGVHRGFRSREVLRSNRWTLMLREAPALGSPFLLLRLAHWRCLLFDFAGHRSFVWYWVYSTTSADLDRWSSQPKAVHRGRLYSSCDLVTMLSTTSTLEKKSIRTVGANSSVFATRSRCRSPPRH